MTHTDKEHFLRNFPGAERSFSLFTNLSTDRISEIILQYQNLWHLFKFFNLNMIQRKPIFNFEILPRKLVKQCIVRLVKSWKIQTKNIPQKKKLIGLCISRNNMKKHQCRRKIKVHSKRKNNYNMILI